MPATSVVIAIGFECGLLLAGLALLWRFVVSPAARAQPRPQLLTEWTIPGTDFLRFLLAIVCCSMIAALAANLLMKFRPFAGPPKIILLTACSHAGMLTGIAIFKLGIERVPLATAGFRRSDLVSGAVTFLISVPIVIAVALPWRAWLKLCGLDLEHQDLVDMFVNARSPTLLGLMITLAIATAPVTEEMLFRAGLFRFLRTRVHRWAALLGPACLFAALHQNLASFLPLVALGIVFSLAYERTGRIGTSIVAHALFNLFAIVQVFSGITE